MHICNNIKHLNEWRVTITKLICQINSPILFSTIMLDISLYICNHFSVDVMSGPNFGSQTHLTLWCITEFVTDWLDAQMLWIQNHFKLVITFHLHVWWLVPEFWSLHNMELCIVTKHLYSGSSVLNRLCQKCGLIQRQLCKLKSCCSHFLGECFTFNTACRQTFVFFLFSHCDPH